MERCEKCGRAHPSGASCGASSGQGERPNAFPDPAPALSRANLLRMRGRWAEAADLCVEVLRMDPANATGHSLLGDIYQDQGRAEEARHWYQLALEINPASEADRLKLTRCEEALEARQQRAEWAAVIEGRSQPVATSLLVRESLQRIGAIAGAGVCGIILVMAIFASIGERSATGDETEVSPRFGQKPRAVATAETWQEQALVKKARESGVHGPAQLARAEIDPVTQSLSVRVFFPLSARENLTTPRLRELIMREGYRWSFVVRNTAAALRQPEEVTQRVRVAVVGPPSSAVSTAGPELLLSGVLSRSDLVVDADQVTGQELAAFYSAVEPPLWGGDLGPG
jgi:hypothetical protein